MSINVLCLETSGKQCSVALASDGVCIHQISAEGEWSHSAQITLLIDQLLKDKSMDFSDLSAIALSKGPGSYTGLRVGASAAKALCYSQEIPLLAIDTLKIIAQPFLKLIKDTNVVIPMIDARRQEVYYNIYDKELHPQQETTNLILEAESLNAYPNAIFCGDGAEKASKILNVVGAQFEFGPVMAENMSFLSFQAYQKQSFEDIAYFNPFYLKPPNITKSKKSIF